MCEENRIANKKKSNVLTEQTKTNPQGTLKAF